MSHTYIEQAKAIQRLKGTWFAARYLHFFGYPIEVAVAVLATRGKPRS